MSRKTKINVLLPFKMVGELEEKSRLGKRSKFIQDAIRSRLDGEENFSFKDIPTGRLLGLLHARYEEDQVFKLMIQNRIKELAE